MLQFIRGVQSSLDCLSAFSQFIALGVSRIFSICVKNCSASNYKAGKGGKLVEFAVSQRPVFSAARAMTAGHASSKVHPVCTIRPTSCITCAKCAKIACERHDVRQARHYGSAIQDRAG